MCHHFQSPPYQYPHFNKIFLKKLIQVSSGAVKTQFSRIWDFFCIFAQDETMVHCYLIIVA